MKGIFKTFATLSAFAIFIILNWATSKDLNYIDLDAEASIYQDSLLVLNNLDSIAITNAELLLIHNETAITEVSAYAISGYNLAAFSTDTIAITDFINSENQVYPDTIPPVAFSLSFDIPGQDSFAGFSTDFE